MACKHRYRAEGKDKRGGTWGYCARCGWPMRKPENQKALDDLKAFNGTPEKRG